MSRSGIEIVYEILRSKDGPTQGSLEERRMRIEKAGELTPLLAGVQVEAIDPQTSGGVSGEWLRAKSGSAKGVVLYLHGGGYVMGSIQSHRDLASRLALASGARVFNLNYRLAPEHPFPAARDDAVAAYLWLIQAGVKSDEIVLAGDSA